MAKTILIVDDDASIVDAVEIILRDAGYEVISTTDGNETQTLLGQKPDLILMDILMAGADGRNIIKDIKKDPGINKIPILVVSANKYTKEISKELGAADYLVKPFEMEELLEKVQKKLA